MPPLLLVLPTSRIFAGSGIDVGSTRLHAEELRQTAGLPAGPAVVVAFFRLAVSFMLTRMVTMSPTCAAR